MVVTNGALARALGVANAISKGPRPEPKAFVFATRVIGDNTAFHVPNKWGADTPKKDTNLFIISDLVLDLDNVDSKTVRPVGSDDEARLDVLWSVEPSEKRVEERLARFRRQLMSQKHIIDFRPPPANHPWFLGSHDVVSTALHGAPKPSLQVAAPVSNSRDEFQNVYAVGGIAEHALESDASLICWLEKRRGQRRNALRGAPLPDALQRLDSIRAIRRTVFNSLAAASDPISPPPAVLSADDSDAIRKACEYVISRKEQKEEEKLEVLHFLGNLAQRLVSSGSCLPSALRCYALRLSGEVAILDAAAQHLDTGFTSTIWKSSREMHDVLATLHAFKNHLRSGLEKLGDPHQQQMLLQLLCSGEEDADEVSRKSTFRSIALMALCEAGQTLKAEALGIYSAYISLLGHLGAVSVLWKEWRLTGRGIETEVLQWQSGGLEGTSIFETFRSATMTALSAVTLNSVGGAADMSLADCVDRDLHGMTRQGSDEWLLRGPVEEHSHGSWLDSPEARAFLEMPSENGEIREALDGPYDRWMQAVRRLAAEAHVPGGAADGGDDLVGRHLRA